MSDETPPQDEWHQRVLALEEGLLPGRGDRRLWTDHRGRPAGPRGGINFPAMTWFMRALFVGVGLVGILKAIF